MPTLQFCKRVRQAALILLLFYEIEDINYLLRIFLNHFHLKHTLKNLFPRSLSNLLLRQYVYCFEIGGDQRQLHDVLCTCESR